MAWYSVKEAAERLGVSPRAVRKRIKAGSIESREAPNPGGGRTAHEVWLGERTEPVVAGGTQGDRAEPSGTERNRTEPANGTGAKKPTQRAKNERNREKRTEPERTEPRIGERNRTEPDDWKVGLTEKQIEVALFRHQIVSAVLAEPFRERGAKKAELVAREWEVPCSKKRRLTESTINRWITLWNRGGLSPGSGLQELPLGVAECRQEPFLLVDIVGGRCLGCTSDRLQKVPINLHVFRPGHYLVLQISGVAPSATGMTNRHREQNIGLLTDRMGRGDVASSRAHSATCSKSCLAPKMPSGLIRIMAPFAWLSGLGRPRRPPETVMPQSKGPESSQNK